MIFLFYPKSNQNQFKFMMLAFLTIRTLTWYWLMPQCFHRVTLRSSPVATLEDLLTGYRVTGLLSNARRCSNILPFGKFSKGIRTNLRWPDGWWRGTCGLFTEQIRSFSRSSRAIPRIWRKVEGSLLRRRAHLPLCVGWGPIQYMGSGHSYDFGHLTTSKTKGVAIST